MFRIWICIIFSFMFCRLQGQRGNWLPEFSGGIFSILHAERFNQVFSEQFAKPDRILSVEWVEIAGTSLHHDEVSLRYLRNFSASMDNSRRWEMDENARIKCYCEVEKGQRPCEKNSIRTVFHYNPQGKPDTVSQWEKPYAGEEIPVRYIIHYNKEGNPDTVKTLLPGGKTSLLVFEYQDGREVAMKSGPSPDRLMPESLTAYDARGNVTSEIEFRERTENGRLTSDTTYAVYFKYDSKNRVILERKFHPFMENGESILKFTMETRNLFNKKFLLSDTAKFASDNAEQDVQRMIYEYNMRKKLRRSYHFRGTELQEVRSFDGKVEAGSERGGVLYTHHPRDLNYWSTYLLMDGKGNIFRKIHIRKDKLSGIKNVQSVEQFKFEYR